MNKPKNAFFSIRKKLKEIAILAGKPDSKNGQEKIHGLTLDLIMEVIDVENTFINKSATRLRTVKEKPAEKLGEKKGKPVKKRTKKNQGRVTNAEAVRMEVTKVSRRLPTWANAQQQMNAKILTTYLRLCQENNADFVHESELAAEFPDKKKYNMNVNTMKSMSKNNAKLFNVVAKKIYIWDPVKEAVAEYKDKVLGYN